MKKALGVLSVFLGIGFIICFLIGICLPLKEAVPDSSEFVYKLCTSVQLFLFFLPIMLITGFIVSFSIQFGHNAEGSEQRFSVSMFNRYKNVVIVSLFCVLILTFANEFIGTVVSRKKSKIVNQPRIISEYINVGNNLLENGFYKRAIQYANAALVLDEKSEEARNLRDKANFELNKEASGNIQQRLAAAENLSLEIKELTVDSTQIAKSYECLQIAKEAFNSQSWFNAHYYAELGIKLCTSKDPNYEELRMLSSQAWNNITKEKNLNKTEAQQIFQKKYEGYLALVQDDDLRAYYLFRNLYKSSVEMQKDADVIFYLDVASNRLLEKYFFIDETFELKSFETSNDVCFSYDYIDGSQDIVYFKGLTTVKETGDAIQYLRDLYVISFTKENKLYRTMYVPYAKVKPVSVEYIDYSSKNMLGIDNSMTYVPYVMLKSIGRDFAEQQSSPLYTYSDGTTSDMPEFMILPLEFEKFTLLEMTNEEPKNLPIMKLYKLVSVVDDYGYSQSVYAQTLLNRLLYPLFMLIVFVALASFAWNNKIGSKQYFKFSWVAGFPFFILASGFLYNIVMYLFKIMNYVMVSFAGGITSLIIAIVVYVVVLIVVSVYFLARKDNED